MVHTNLIHTMDDFINSRSVDLAEEFNLTVEEIAFNYHGLTKQQNNGGVKILLGKNYTINNLNLCSEKFISSAIVNYELALSFDLSFFIYGMIFKVQKTSSTDEHLNFAKDYEEYAFELRKIQNDAYLKLH